MSQIEKGRARPPGGPQETPQSLPARVNLNHATPSWVRPGSMFFVTGCCAERGRNRLCFPDLGHALLASAQFYHERHDWFLRLWLLMPDHFHALIAPAPDKQLNRLLGAWKRFTTTQHQIDWQKNFIDHRLRSDESWELKAQYIRQNPVRAGLIKEGEIWPYMIENEG